MKRNSKNTSLNSALTQFVKRVSKDERYYLELGIAKDIDEGNLIFTLQSATGDPDSEVSMNIENSDNYIVPADGAIVLIGYINKTDKYLLYADQVDKIVMRGGNNGELINIDDLTTKLNTLTKEIRDIRTQLASHTHTGVTTGTGVSGISGTLWKTVSDFNKNDYKDDKVLH